MRHRDTTSRHQLAQVDIARILAPLDSPEPAGFVAALDPVNAVADAADGFVWRLKTDDDNATTLRVFDSDWLIVNVSAWRDPKALSAYVSARRIPRCSADAVSFARAEEAMTALW